MDLLIVNPSSTKMYQEPALSFQGIEPPFWAGLIASFIREHGYKVMLLDADAENWSPQYTAKRIAEAKPRLTVIVVQGVNPSASSTPKMTAVMNLVEEILDWPHEPIVIMGLHPSALPGKTLRDTGADFVCQGEGFFTIWGLLERMPYSKIPGLSYWDGWNVISNPRPKVLGGNKLPPLAWDLLDMSKYRAHNWHCLDNLEARQPYAVIYTSLGCPYNCHFCNIHQMYLGTKPSIRYRKAEDVVKEIDLLVNKYSIRNIKVMDELFTLKRDYVLHLCDLIIERNYDLNMWAYGRVGLVDSEMLKKMKQAGTNWVCYGIESASEGVRRGIAKRFGQSKMYETIEMTHNAGMHIQANFIFGLPDDDHGTMRDTLEMAKAYNFEWCNFYTCMAYPGCKLYDDALKQGVKLPETWDAYSQLGYETVPLDTKYVQGSDVLAFRDKAFQEYFSRPEYLKIIRSKFGSKAVEHIKGMLQHKVRRKLLGD